ncbi:hypothetical protein D3C87_1676650 [compost metagenome]
METAKFIPFRSVAAEIGLGTFSPLMLDGRKPFAIANQNRVIIGRSSKQRLDQRSSRTVLRQAEVSPGSFLIAVDQRVFVEKLQVAGDTRLRLPENFGQVGYRQVALCQQGEQPEACRLPDRLQNVNQSIEC